MSRTGGAPTCAPGMSEVLHKVFGGESLDMPRARVGAPPVRDTIDSSPTPVAASVISCAAIGGPDSPSPLT